MPLNTPRKPHTRRFFVLPRHASGVYLADLSGGVIKVGLSYCLRNRLIDLYRISKRSGRNLTHAVAFPCDDAGDVEKQCIRALSAIAETLPRCVEYFIGLSFDEALRAIAPICNAVCAAPVHIGLDISPQASQSAITPICSPSQT